MPEYSYHAVDASGHATRGVMAAENELALERRLREVGYWLIDASSSSRKHAGGPSRVSRAELIEFLYGMASLLAAGVTAADAFRAMVEETENESFRVVLEDIELNLNAGSSIHDAISKYPGIFNAQSRHLINAGEFSASLSASNRPSSCTHASRPREVWTWGSTRSCPCPPPIRGFRWATCRSSSKPA